jgi:hypothetical protein
MVESALIRQSLADQSPPRKGWSTGTLLFAALTGGIAGAGALLAALHLF